MSGHDLARALRATEPGARMHLIAVSGWGRDEDRGKSLAVGFDRHLVKPVDPVQLESVIAELRGRTGPA